MCSWDETNIVSGRKNSMSGIRTQEVHRWPFTGKIIVRIGKLIPYSDNVDDMVQKWGESIEELTGFKYIPGEE